MRRRGNSVTSYSNWSSFCSEKILLSSSLSFIFSFVFSEGLKKLPSTHLLMLFCSIPFAIFLIIPNEQVSMFFSFKHPFLYPSIYVQNNSGLIFHIQACLKSSKRISLPVKGPFSSIINTLNITQLYKITWIGCVIATSRNAVF